ncbi:MAG: YitT family protein [Actinobacteria bacterium]|nr:MAG: YitT family protein [Actinomycetota bacterium]
MNVPAPLARLHPARILKARPVRDYALMTLGVLIAAWGLDSFLVPNRIAAGGLSGIATVVYHLAKGQGVTAPVGVQMLVANVALLALVIRARGWRYGAKTLFGLVGLSVAIDALAPFAPHMAADDLLLASLYGGALMGLGIGLVFKGGGNTGGTDIVAALLTPKVSFGVGQIMFVLDAMVVAVAGVAFGARLALYGAVAVLVGGAVIDLVLEGFSVEKAVFIISDRNAEIAEGVLYEVGRGATGIAARGLYTGESREMVFTVVSRNQLDDLKRLVASVDPGALVIISDVHEAIGEGFKSPRG